MLRRTLLAASRSEALRRLAGEVGAARAVAMRFVAGESLDDALDVAKRLNAAGMSVSLDHLGEDVGSEDVARRAAHAYLEAIDRLHAAGIDGQVSVKLTQLGLDVSADLCRELVAGICDRAASAGADVTVDMEGSPYTARTVDLVLDLRRAGHANVGCAVQAYLYRTPEDVEALTAAGASLRLCKGAYAEPPSIAYQHRGDVAAAFAALTERLMRAGTYPRIATHDEALIHHAKNAARRYEVGADGFEFQMLHGVGEPLQRRLVDDGYRLRVYVPYGTEWYPYFVRRIAERPANLAFFLRAVAGRRRRGRAGG